MTTATLGALFIEEYPEAVGVFLFYQIGELFEEYALINSKKAIIDVSSLKVEKAEILKNGEFIKIDAENIEIGDILNIKVGERIVVDGIVEEGESKLDTSAVNGEPIPLSIQKGDTILSGSINISETFTLKATALVSDSMISKIAKAIEDASATKPTIDKFITKFSKIYTPIIVLISLITAIIPSLITGDWKKWINSALTFLVISCPCALVISVPLAFFSGIGAGSKLGILFKGGNVIETLDKIKVIAFDKTGTLTEGNFTITDIKTYGNMSENEILSLCASCEKNSNHPVAKSIMEYSIKKNIKICDSEKTKEIAGKGIITIINNKTILCGNERLLSENGITSPEKNDTLGSVVYLAINNKIEGRLIISDNLKKTSSLSVSLLKQMGIKTAILTGDKSENAIALANYLGIDFAKGDLLPDDKLKEISNIRKENGEIMFVGDGLNDGPVLAGADIGGAMFNGSDLALQAADMIFMNSEPETIVKAKKIANKTLFISYENIFFSLLIKIVIIFLGLLGISNMWLAVFADSGIGMLLILNSIRVLNTKSYK
jgi:Cd2+/Zn2+-exporting ATPase